LEIGSVDSASFDSFNTAALEHSRGERRDCPPNQQWSDRPPNFFLARHAVEDAIRKRFQFNIIHISAGLKADIMLPKQTPFAATEHQRARRLTDPDGLSAMFASPEDVILNKLIFYRMGESDKHLRDIAGIMKVMGDNLDRDYIAKWSAPLGVVEPWTLVQRRVSEST
jgi:hypothetical protein